jgi:hypothetical protein
VHEHEASDQRVHRPTKRDVLDPRLTELDILDATGVGASLGLCERFKRMVDAKDRSTGSNNVRGEERQVSDSAADVKHPHVPVETRRLKEATRGLLEERALPLQALEFARRNL